HVDTGDGLGRHDDSAHWSRRFCNGLDHALVKELGVGKEERRIPTKQHQAGNTTRSGIACDVVVAANTVDSTEHCVVWSPAIPQELNDRNDYRDTDAGNHTEYRNTDEAHHGQPEFPLLDAKDATEVCEFEQANRCCDHDRSECATRQIL